MRSRYTAFVQKNIDYLVDTRHPQKRQPSDFQTIQDWAHRTTWQGLQVIRSRGENTDDKGMVEFIADFSENGKRQRMHEISTFQKVEGHWYYVSGQLQKPQSPSVGRNDPCPCGSGKKYKKCCK